ncbi:hypothetical protein ABPG74_014174 [Tetrahymena malaccensis]
MKQNDIKEIEELNLSNNNIESTDNISLLTNLKVLNISFNLLTKVYGLPKFLTQLNASSNKINELFSINNNLIQKSCFDQLTHLTILDLSKNEIAKLHSNIFDNCQNLSEIDLSNNKISGQLECFVKLPELKRLNLSFNKIADWNVLYQLKGCQATTLNIQANAITKLNSQQCENLLKKMLPKAQYICVNQDRSLTPQPKKNQIVENTKNSSALPKKTQKEINSPFKKRLFDARTDVSPNNLFAKRVFQIDDVSSTRQADSLFQTRIPKDQFFLNNSLTQERQNIPLTANLFSSISSPEQAFSQQQKLKQQEQNVNDEKSKHCKICSQKISILKEKQLMDQHLINQQTKIINDLVQCKNLEQKNEMQLDELEGISFKEDTQLSNSLNLTYIKAKFDILLIAFSNYAKLDLNKIDENLKQIIGDQTILTSQQKFDRSKVLCDRIFSVNSSKPQY